MKLSNLLPNYFTLPLRLQDYSCKCCLDILYNDNHKRPKETTCSCFVDKFKHILRKNNLKEKDFVLVRINLLETLNVSFKKQLQDSVEYRNKCGLVTVIGSLENHNTYINYCENLLYEIKEIIIQYKDFNDTHAVDYYFNPLKDFYKQNGTVLKAYLLNPLLEFNNRCNKLRIHMYKSIHISIPIIFIPAHYFSLKDTKTREFSNIILLSDTFLYYGQTIDIFTLKFVKDTPEFFTPISLSIIRSYITPFLNSVSLTKLYAFISVVAAKSQNIPVDFETLLLSVFMQSPLDLNLGKDLYLWLYERLNYFLSFHIISIIFVHIPAFSSISYYKNNRRYITHITSSQYSWDCSAVDVSKFQDFISWNVKVHHNFIYDYLYHIVTKAENILQMDSFPYTSNILPSDIEVLKSYFLYPLEKDYKQSKKAIYINSRYLLNVIINNWNSKIFLSKVKAYFYQDQYFEKQFTRYIKECCLLLRILDISLKISSLKDNASFLDHKAIYIDAFHNFYNRDRNNLYEPISLDLFSSNDNKLSNKTCCKILALLSHITVSLVISVAQQPIIQLIKNHENFK